MSKSPFTTSCNVWLYRNIITSQVLVSPSRILSNNRSMAQLPPNRRLHPTALRKDHWVPLLQATFSDASTMRQVYSRMLQYRQWRAAEPVPVERRTMRTKARRRLEIDQIATSVADLSASCDTYAKTGAVEIKWYNEEEKVYAKKWPKNVTHLSGLDGNIVLNAVADTPESSDVSAAEIAAAPESTPARSGKLFGLFR